MKQTFCACFLLAVQWSATVLCGAEPRVLLPAEIKAKPGRLVRIEATTDGKVVKWLSMSEDADIVPFPPDGKVALFTAPSIGRHRVIAWTALGDVPSEAASCVVVVGNPDPVPPPKPVDSLLQAVQKAYSEEADTNKAVLKGSLASLYKMGAETASDTAITTWGRLFEVMGDAARRMGVAGKLPGVQKVIQSELQLSLPADTEKMLDAFGRDSAAKAFRKIATLLETVQ